MHNKYFISGDFFNVFNRTQRNIQQKVFNFEQTNAKFRFKRVKIKQKALMTEMFD